MEDPAPPPMELTLLVEVVLGCDKEDTAAMPPPCMELV